MPSQNTAGTTGGLIDDAVVVNRDPTQFEVTASDGVATIRCRSCDATVCARPAWRGIDSLTPWAASHRCALDGDPLTRGVRGERDEGNNGR